MNKKLTGLLIVALLPGCTPEPPPSETPTATVREAFHPSKPLRLELIATRDASGEQAEIEWLEQELRHLLMRGQMQAAQTAAPGAQKPPTEAFILRVAIPVDAKQASVALIAPDQVLERERTIEIVDATRLGVVQGLAEQLPPFLRAQGGSQWTSFIGTDDARIYENFTRASVGIQGRDSRGFTRPPALPARTRTIERLERLTRNQPRFARAQALLAIGYLSLGGEDEASLTQLAETSAERAVARDANLPNAHAALGLVALRRNEWIAAREQFDAALTLDPDNAPSLEGLACLLADAGRYAAAQPVARRAVALQPMSIGARECLAYASGEPGSKQVVAQTGLENQSPAVAQVHALQAILAGNTSAAEQVLRGALLPESFRLWAAPLLRAANSREHVPDALRSITRAANDERIDASTEILCGAALEESEFVLNRMNRLLRQQTHAPLRILWLPATTFLREHAQFEDLISATGLPAFWQEYGPPDVCAAEPKTYGCKLQRGKN